MVNGMRVRVRLDETRLRELLAGLGSSSAGGGMAAVLACLGDLVTLSFAPGPRGAPGLLQCFSRDQ